ncbi:MAG: RNA 2',3'-cyclic phosphodiesterase [Ignavibacteria bacterium]|nr:RNA 2',3'-cyclic phosphodiesterase [Ignavibacteria bacterium]
MRLFISINLNQETKEKLFCIQSELKEKISQKYSYSVKWENKDNFHLTLFFLGEVDNDKSEKIISSLEKIEIPDASELVLRGKSLNAFPSLKNPRVLFVDLFDENKLIEKLYYKIAESMEMLGFRPDKKFHNHITLGRIKRESGIHSVDSITDINCDFTYSTGSFYLMKSTLTPAGAIHKTVKEFPVQ